MRQTVTPYVGVWIETVIKQWIKDKNASHPTWVCGLKHKHSSPVRGHKHVTPYVGVWIETFTNRVFMIKYGVTPYVGVWIETSCVIAKGNPKNVTPYVGVWIETRVKRRNWSCSGSHPTWVCGLKQVLFPILRLPYVTPYVGVWIETHEFCFFHPVRIVTPYVGVWIETSSAFAPYGLYARHTLRGCVD